MGIVLKRAKYFITCDWKYFTDINFFKKNFIERNLILEEKVKEQNSKIEQLVLFND